VAVTEIVLAGGERITTEEEAKVVESAILSAARGSIMELAWVIDARTGRRVGINPDHVVMLRELAPGS
jgi:cation transporter-like permease